MKILILGINFAPELTGIGKYTGDLAAFLAAGGHEVRAVTAPPYYPYWRILPGYSSFTYKKEEWRGVRVFRVPLWVPRNPSGLTRLIHLASFAVSSLPPVLLQALWKPEVVFAIAPAFFSAPAALLAARLAGAKAWLHVQDFELDAALALGMLPENGAINKFSHLLEGWVLRGFDRVSTISVSMRDRLLEKKVPLEKTVLLPNWVDAEAIRPLQGPNLLSSELGLPSDTIKVLYSGNMGAKQGLEILVDAARLLGEREDIQFILCGEGAARSGLERRANGLPNLNFLPLQPLERLNELLNLADIHVLPQRAGAADLVMPSKLTGMLASGRPVIASADHDTEVGRLVGQVGRLVPPEDPGALASAIVELATDRRERERLGAGGRKYVETNWSREKIMGRVEEGLDQLIFENTSMRKAHNSLS